MPRNHGRIKQSPLRVVSDVVGKSRAIKITVIKTSIKPDKIIILNSPPIAKMGFVSRHLISKKIATNEARKPRLLILMAIPTRAGLIVSIINGGESLGTFVVLSDHRSDEQSNTTIIAPRPNSLKLLSSKGEIQNIVPCQAISILIVSN